MLLTLFAFALALGLLVTFHELGHYWVARLCGVRILRFSVGFGPVLLRRQDRHGTEWAVSAVPLGGYVKMLDDAPADADPVARRQAFNTQPLLRRAAVVAAGPAANLLLAVVLYALLGMWGTLEPAAILAAPAPGTPAARAGIQAGATLQAVDGVSVASWTQARWRLVEPLSLGGTLALTLKAPDGRVHSLTLHSAPQGLAPDGPDPLAAAGLALAAPRPLVGEVMPAGAAEAAGLRPGDEILAVTGGPQPLSVQGFVDTVRDHPGQTLSLTVRRQGARLAVPIVPQAATDEAGQPIGRIGALVHGDFDQVLVRHGPLDSLGIGLRRTADMSLFTLRMMGRMLIGDVSWKNISGPVTIAEYAGQTARIGLESYLGFLALISISIGVLNLLPIPLLDGGHLLFYLLEAMRGGRPIPEHIRDLSARLGLGIVLSLMFLALFNDFSRLFS